MFWILNYENLFINSLKDKYNVIKLLLTAVPVVEVSKNLTLDRYYLFIGFLPWSMQGKKTYQEKLLNEFRMNDRVPEHSFYRWLKSTIS